MFAHRPITELQNTTENTIDGTSGSIASAILIIQKIGRTCQIAFNAEAIPVQIGEASAFFMNIENELKKLLKIFFAAHHFTYISKDITEIARIVRVKKKTLEDWMTSTEWREALEFWGYSPDLGDLRVAERVWKLMIEYGHDLSPIDFPDDWSEYTAEYEKPKTESEHN